MNSPEHKFGAWIFVSHSYRDSEQVRQVRNELKKRGHNPLLLFLKCLQAAAAPFSIANVFRHLTTFPVISVLQITVPSRRDHKI